MNKLQYLAMNRGKFIFDLATGIIKIVKKE